MRNENPSVTLMDYSMSYSNRSIERPQSSLRWLSSAYVPTERVLIMLPDGPGFAEAFAGTIKQGAVPLPVNPPLPAHDIVAAAAEASARLVLASVDQIYALADLGARPPVLIEGPQGLWAAALRLH